MLTGDRTDASRSIQGLLRSASAIDALIERIRYALRDGLLPQRDELFSALEFEPSIVQAIERYVYEEVAPLQQWASMRSNFAGVALQIAQLEDALVDLRRAVSWSSRVSGFNWWLRQRQAELGMEELLVIAGPGSCRDFFVERVSGIAKGFEQANLYLRLSEEKISELDRIRILTVPQSDGASAKWHPISLGHELAHLKYRRSWILSWLATQDEDEPAAAAAIQIARGFVNTAASNPTTERWFSILCSWLLETACDAALAHYYGDQGINALATYLSVHSDIDDGEDHPSPDMRLAALRSSDASGLNSFTVDPSESLYIMYRRNSYCRLAVPLRNSIFTDLGAKFIDPEAREIVLERSTEALARQITPNSRIWSHRCVLEKPATIESSLVGSIWSATDVDATEERTDSRLLHQAESRIEHSVDFLQFLHRFDRVKEDSRIHAPNSEDRPTNVLFVSGSGIRHDPDESVARSSHDVRLGRHFVVFRRNQIATLNALDAESRQIQEAVEVGWGDTFILHPGEMVLAVTLESIIMSHDCMAQVLSRSSLGRMGLLSATAIQVQPGFRGCLTLELVNLASVPLVLSPGQRIAQIVPALAVGGAGQYDGKYQDQDGRPKFSAVIDDWEMPILRKLNMRNG